MTILKTFAEYLYTKFVPANERKAKVLVNLTEADREAIAYTFFRKEAPLFERGSRSYNQAHQITEDFILQHHKASNFTMLCRSHTRRNSPNSYFLQVALSNLLTSDGTPTSKATEIIERLKVAQVEANKERNVIKRRSVIRNVIKQEYPNLTGEQLSLAVELVLSGA